MPSGPFLRRVVIENYRSIEYCNVELGPVTILVGPNGSGKSNFLDAIRFVSDALRTSLAQAIRDRGGFNEVLRRGTGNPTSLAIRLEFQVLTGEAAHFAFRVGQRADGGFMVEEEQGRLDGAEPYHIPGPMLDRLAITRFWEDAPIVDALAAMEFYNLNPSRIRELQPPDSGIVLYQDGANAASVWRRISELQPDLAERVDRYLAFIAPGLISVEPAYLGPKAAILFKQQSRDQPRLFYAESMSDGTLRAFGILLALFQLGGEYVPPLVGIEEPETALHPGAIVFLRDAFREVSDRKQVLVTSHSPDLLDEIDLDRETLLAVHAEDGVTKIAPIDKTSREVVREGLYTPGELLRLNQLAPSTNHNNAAPIFDSEPV
jgi:predicted ATPase